MEKLVNSWGFIWDILFLVKGIGKYLIFLENCLRKNLGKNKLNRYLNVFKF